MKHIRIFYHIALTFVLISTGGIIAQNTGNTTIVLTLKEVVEKSLAHHYSPQIQMAAIKQAEGQKKSAGLLPNPVLSYYRESLKNGGLETGEWVLSGALPLNSLWGRWSALSAASAKVGAAEARLADIKRNLAFAVKKAFVEYAHAEKIQLGWEQGIKMLEEINRVAKARVAEGDISGYNYHRTALELRRFEKHIAAATAELFVKKRTLSHLVDPETKLSDFAIAPLPIIALPAISFEKMNADALANRPDLKAAQLLIQNSQSALRAAKWQGFPNTSIAAGYKEQQDEFSGPVIQLNVAIPLFDRNQGRIQESKALMQSRMLEADLLKKQVTLEVRNAYDRFQIYRDQYQKITEEKVFPEKLLKIARIAYQEGEMPLLQLIDAVQTYVETFQVQEDLRLQYYLSFYELEKATAMTIY